MTLQGSKHVANLYNKLMCLRYMVLLFQYVGMTSIYGVILSRLLRPSRNGARVLIQRLVETAFR